MAASSGWWGVGFNTLQGEALPAETGSSIYRLESASIPAERLAGNQKGRPGAFKGGSISWATMAVDSMGADSIGAFTVNSLDKK
jgi:hypothetical protein